MKLARRTGAKRKAQITLAQVGDLPPPPGCVTMSIENPYYSRSHGVSASNPKMITANFKRGESYPGYLWANDKITLAEWKAAGIVRFHFERLGGKGAGAIDPSKPFVDGGKAKQDISDGHLLSGHVMRDMEEALGKRGHNLTLRLAGAGEWPKDIIPDNRTQQDYLSLRFRECLETLAVHWKLQKAR